jgi:Lsr2
VARQVVVRVLCDVCQSGEGASALEFSSGRTALEIDLCGEHRQAFTAALAPYVAAARSARAKGGSAAALSTRRDPAQTEAIRAWAKQRGMAIGDRGRIPRDIEAAYNARGNS